MADLQPGCEFNIPVLALRWTHKSVNSKRASGEDHDHVQGSIFKLVEQLICERLTPRELTQNDILIVYVHCGPNGMRGLYSRQNRRLMALLMLQACRRDELHLASCIVRSYKDAHWGCQE